MKINGVTAVGLFVLTAKKCGLCPITSYIFDFQRMKIKNVLPSLKWIKITK